MGGVNGLIISHSRRFVFIHIHKTAGESISASMVPDLAGADLFRRPGVVIETTSPAGSEGQVVPAGSERLNKHSTALEVRDWLGQETWDQYFTFSFVRHPIERALSLYGYVAKAARQPSRPWPKRVLHRLAPGGRTDKSDWLGVKAFRATNSFSEFIRHPLLDEAPGMRPQSASLCDASGEIIVRYVGRYEQINEDFQFVRTELGLPERPLRWKNRGRRRGGTPSPGELPAEDRAYMAAKFEEDFRRFGYEP